MPLDARFLDRFERGVAVRYDEMIPAFKRTVKAQQAKLSAQGLLRSGAHYAQSMALHTREMDARAIVAWETAVRVHRTSGSPLSAELRPDLKLLMAHKIDEQSRALIDLFIDQTLKILQGQPSLSAAPLAEHQQHVRAKHDLEVDLYLDALEAKGEGQAPMTASYNFYGTVGAVQTGANAVANTIQNLGEGGRADLLAALEQVAKAISESGEILGDRKRDELAQLAVEARNELAQQDPNTSKLMMTLTILATAVMAIPSAQPAYESMKLALLSLGITLP